MGYNISETTGATGGGTSGIDTWTFDVALTGADVTTVSGDFDEVPMMGGGASEATQGYTFTVTQGGEYGDLEYDPATGEFEFHVDREAILASGSDQTIVISVTGRDSQGTDTDTIIINVTICVARGTLIDTETGPVPVEELRIGDAGTIVMSNLGYFQLPARPGAHDLRLQPGRSREVYRVAAPASDLDGRNAPGGAAFETEKAEDSFFSISSEKHDDASYQGSTGGKARGTPWAVFLEKDRKKTTKTNDAKGTVRNCSTKT